jgi:hypothetical protein
VSHTAEDIAVLALARARQHTSEVNESRALIYSRTGLRQQELFALANKIDPEFFGVCAHAPVSFVDADDDPVPGGLVNLSTIADPVPTPDLIQRIEVYDAGTSDYAVGEEVNPVRLDDTGSAFAPRVVMRNRVMFGVGTDLAGVDEVRIYYAKIPAAILPSGRTTEIELPDPHWMLLVVDAERDLYRRSVADPGLRDTLVKMADADEAPLLAAFTAYVSAYASSMQTRFG